jgi:hypothetical protein
MIVEHYETKEELVDSLPLAKPYKRFTIYSLLLPNLFVGDVVLCTSQMEATNDLGFNVQFSHAMMVHNTEIILMGESEWPRDSDSYWWDWVRPAVPSGENITPDMHHSTRNLNGVFTVEHGGDHWVSLIAYTASSSAQPGDEIEIEYHQGGISALVFRPDISEVVPIAAGGTFSGEFSEDGTITGTYEVNE